MRGRPRPLGRCYPLTQRCQRYRRVEALGLGAVRPPIRRLGPPPAVRLGRPPARRLGGTSTARRLSRPRPRGAAVRASEEAGRLHAGEQGRVGRRQAPDSAHRRTVVAVGQTRRGMAPGLAEIVAPPDHLAEPGAAAGRQDRPLAGSTMRPWIPMPPHIGLRSDQSRRAASRSSGRYQPPALNG